MTGTEAAAPDVPSGISLAELARTACNAYSRSAGMEALTDDEWEEAAPQWLPVAAWAVGVYDASRDADGDLEFARLADAAYRTYRRAVTGEGDVPPIAAHGRRLGLEWEAVVRHTFGAMLCDPDDLGNSDGREASWADWVRSRLAAGGL
jgi:hypothetical protein